MIKIPNRFLLALICLGAGVVTYSQEALSYNSFIKQVKSNNPLSERAANNGEYAKTQYRAAQGNYDPQFVSSIENKYFTSKNYFTTANAELKQPLVTSQYLKAGYQFGQGPFVNPENYQPASGLPYLGVEANLLQGLFIDRRRADLIKAKYYRDYYTSEQKIQMNELLYASSSSYTDYLLADRARKLFRYFEKLAQERLTGISALVNAGERPSVDTIESSIFLQSRVLDRQSGEVETLKQLNNLFIFLQNRKQAPENTITISDSLDRLYEDCRKNTGSLLTFSVANPLISQYQATQGILETEARLRKELIKPILTVSYNFLADNSAGEQYVLNTNNYKWGAAFSFPLFFRKPYNEYKMANILSENNALETINKQNEISYKRNFVIQTLNIVSEQIINAEKGVNYNKLLVEAEKLKFNNGESSLFILNARENKWLESELKLAEYKTKYIKTYFELVYLDGALNYELQ